MAELIGICGDTGTGKSTSIRTLDPNETMLISVTSKRPPFKGWKKNYRTIDDIKQQEGVGDDEAMKRFNRYTTSNPDKIVKILDYISKNRPDIKHVVIDDFQYVMSFEFMNRASEKSYEKFTEIGEKAWRIFSKVEELREDLKVFVLTHSEVQDGRVKMKTVGKMLDTHIKLEGLFNILLFSQAQVDFTSGKVEYKFLTNHDGSTPARSPMGMFDEQHIDNDLSLVSQKIDEFSEGE